MEIDYTAIVEKRLSAFKQAMILSINTLNIDTILETPDHIIAQYLYDSLSIFGMALNDIRKHKEKSK